MRVIAICSANGDHLSLVEAAASTLPRRPCTLRVRRAGSIEMLLQATSSRGYPWLPDTNHKIMR